MWDIEHIIQFLDSTPVERLDAEWASVSIMHTESGSLARRTEIKNIRRSAHLSLYLATHATKNSTPPYAENANPIRALWNFSTEPPPSYEQLFVVSRLTIIGLLQEGSAWYGLLRWNQLSKDEIFVASVLTRWLELSDWELQNSARMSAGRLFRYPAMFADNYRGGTQLFLAPAILDATQEATERLLDFARHHQTYASEIEVFEHRSSNERTQNVQVSSAKTPFDLDQTESLLQRVDVSDFFSFDSPPPQFLQNPNSPSRALSAHPDNLVENETQKRSKKAIGEWRKSSKRQPNKSKVDDRIVQVFFGTNRARVGRFAFGSGFGDALTLGTCSVRVPEFHRFGQIRRSKWKFWQDRDLTDLTLQRIRISESSTDHWGKIQASLLKQPRGNRTMLLYVHGFNTNFEDAGKRAAQLAFDLKLRGRVAFFSWPSQGTLSGYLADRESVEASEDAFAEYLRALIEESGARRVDILAHSMGNRLISRTLPGLVAKSSKKPKAKFGRLIQAAPDMSPSSFVTLAKTYVSHFQSATLYVSENDRALAFAKTLLGMERVGSAPPVRVISGVDTVSVGEVDTSLIGHGYFASAHPLLYDIALILARNTRPNKRQRLHRETNALGGVYWRLGK